MSWPQVRLSDISEVITGSTPSTFNVDYYGGDIPFITPTQLNKEMYVGDSVIYVTQAGAKAARLIPKNSVMVCCIGSLGKVGISSRPLITNQQINSLVINENIAEPLYVYFYCRTLSNVLENMAPKTTVAIVNKSRFSELSIPLPPLATQQHIARVLEQADQLRKQAQQMERELKQLAQSLFLEMFGDPVTNPKKWPLIHLGDQAELLAGYAFKSNEYSENNQDIKLCRGVNINPGLLDWSDAAYWPEEKSGGLEKFILSDGDIVIAMDRPWISTGFKMARITRNDLPALLLQRVMRVRGQDEVENNYLHYCLNQISFLRHCRITETTVPHISPTDVASFEIFDVPRAERERFFRQGSVIRKSMSALEENRLYFSNMFASLMQRAFNGELTERKAA